MSRGKTGKQVHLKCPNCGNVTPIMKNASNVKESGHLKKFSCPKCKVYSNHEQINDYDTYSYKEKAMKVPVKVYRDRSRVELLIPTTGAYLLKYTKLGQNLVNQNILYQGDYNLLENLILNYLHEAPFQTEVDSYYTANVVLDQVYIKANVNAFILEQLKDLCSAKNMLLDKTLHALFHYIYVNDISLQTDTGDVRQIILEED